MFDSAPESSDLGIRLVADQLFVTSENTDCVHQDHSLIEREFWSVATAISGAFGFAGSVFAGPGGTHRSNQIGYFDLQLWSIHLNLQHEFKYPIPKSKLIDLGSPPIHSNRL